MKILNQCFEKRNDLFLIDLSITTDNIIKILIDGDHGVKVFPRVHTCFNRIDLPIYKSKKDLKKYIHMKFSKVLCLYAFTILQG